MPRTGVLIIPENGREIVEGSLLDGGFALHRGKALVLLDRDCLTPLYFRHNGEFFAQVLHLLLQGFDSVGLFRKFGLERDLLFFCGLDEDPLPLLLQVKGIREVLVDLANQPVN